MRAIRFIQFVHVELAALASEARWGNKHDQCPVCPPLQRTNHIWRVKSIRCGGCGQVCKKCVVAKGGLANGGALWVAGEGVDGTGQVDGRAAGW